MREAHVAEVLSDVTCLWGPFDLPRSRRQRLAFFVRILLQSFAHFGTRSDSIKMTKLVEFTTSVIRLIQKDLVALNLVKVVHQQLWKLLVIFRKCVEPTLGTQPACVGHGQAAQIVESSVRKDPEGAVNAHRRITFRGRSLFIYPCFSLSLVAATNVGGPTNTCAYPCRSEMCSFSWTADLEWHVLPSHL